MSPAFPHQMNDHGKTGRTQRDNQRPDQAAACQPTTQTCGRVWAEQQIATTITAPDENTRQCDDPDDLADF